MDTLLGQFRTRLKTEIEVLEQVEQVLQGQLSEAHNTTQQVAHRLQQTSILYNYPPLRKVGNQLGKAGPEELLSSLPQLVEMLKVFLSAKPDFAPQQVLIVGQDVQVKDAVQTLFAQSPIGVHTISTATEALHLLKEQSYIIVLIPLVLSDMDGRDLAIRIRSRYTSKDTSIVFITPPLSPHIEAGLETLNITAHFTKPIQEGYLMEALLEMVGRHQKNKPSALRDTRKDPQTGLLQRKAFDRAFQRVLYMAQNANFPLSLIHIRLKSKALSKEREATFQNQALQSLGSLMANFVQKSATRVRWAKDEMLVVLQNIAPSQIEQKLKRIQTLLQEEPFEGAAGASFSAAIVNVPMEGSPEMAIRTTDHLLYVAQEVNSSQILSETTLLPTLDRSIWLTSSDSVTLTEEVEPILRERGFTLRRIAGDAVALPEPFAPPAAVIVDLNQPHGFEVITAVRRLQGCAKVPILMLSNLGTELEPAHGFQLGADDILFKPCTALLLLDKVYDLLRISSFHNRPAPKPNVMSPPTKRKSEERLGSYSISEEKINLSDVLETKDERTASSSLSTVIPSETPVNIPSLKIPSYFPPGDSMSETPTDISTSEPEQPTPSRFRAAFAEAIRNRLSQNQEVALPSLGTLRIHHTGSHVDNRQDGQVVLHPPNNEVVFEPTVPASNAGLEPTKNTSSAI